jgi:glycerate kinase
VEETWGCSSRHQMYPARRRRRNARNGSGKSLALALYDGSRRRREGKAESMRVLVATDSIGALSSRQAGEVIASGWSSVAEISVLPIGDADVGFAVAYADLAGLTITSQTIDDVTVMTGHKADTGVVQVHGPNRGAGIPYQQSSRPIGEAIAGLLSKTAPHQMLVDLAGLWVHDGGAGLLAALGATADRPLDQGVAGLEGLNQIDLAPARSALGDADLVGVVPAAQLSEPLLGLRGITSRAGREANVEPEQMLRTDATLERFARLASLTHAGAPGSGACGGVGFGVLALGGRLTTGPALALASPAGQRGLRGVDLIVTGCSVFDFASRGGEVVAAMAEAAAAALAPCIVIAGEVIIGSREMRTMGIEAAYALQESLLDNVQGEVSHEDLAMTAHRVARSWSW